MQQSVDCLQLHNSFFFSRLCLFGLPVIVFAGVCDSDKSSFASFRGVIKGSLLDSILKNIGPLYINK
jgi:hypothetical protein